MNRLKEIRFYEKISQHKLALLAGVHQSRISLIENGLVLPRDDEKKKLSKTLGVRPEEIWADENGQIA